MTHPSHEALWEELHRLFIEQHEQRLDAAGQARLESLVCEDPVAEQIYAELLLDAATLRAWSASLASAPPLLLHAPASVGESGLPPTTGWLNRPIVFSLTSAGVFIAALLLVLAQWNLPLWRDAAREPPVVARVLQSRDALWDAASLSKGVPPSALQAGRTIELLQGAVTVQFGSGAVALVEGPAVLTPHAQNAMRLHNGKLAAHVPPQAAGFWVNTPSADVIDLGTEFSVEVRWRDAAAGAEDHRETEVHVLQGSVQVHPLPKGTRRSARLMTAGSAAVFRNSSSQGLYVEEKKMNRAIFLSLALALAASQSDSAHAVSIFNGGNLAVAGNWSSGLPTSVNPGEINVNGTTPGATIGFGAGSVVNFLGGNLTDPNPAATTGPAFNLVSGTWNQSGGSIVSRFFLSNGANTVYNISGGLIAVKPAVNSQLGIANGGTLNISGSAVLDATGAGSGFLILSGANPGVINFAPGWTGSFTAPRFRNASTPMDWFSVITNNPSVFRYNGAPLTEEILNTRFVISNNGTTLSMVPEPSSALLLGAGGLVFAAGFRLRRRSPKA